MLGLLLCYGCSNEAVRRHRIPEYVLDLLDKTSITILMSLDIAAFFPSLSDTVKDLLDMSLNDVDDVEKTAGLDFISPAETVCDAGLQSTQDAKLHVSRGIYFLQM